MNFNDIKNKLVDSKGMVEKGLSKAGDVAKTKYGHSAEIDKGIKAADSYLDSQYAKEHPQATDPTTATTTPEDPNTV